MKRKQKLKWYARGGGIAQMGPFPSEQDAVNESEKL